MNTPEEQQRRGRGRPTVPPDERRTRQITVAFSRDELARLEADAHRQGVLLATNVRHAALEAAARRADNAPTTT